MPNLQLMRRWAVLLDSAFRVPGTNIRFGFDAMIGLVPGWAISWRPVFTLALLGTALTMRVPAVVVARMVLNAGIDMLIGLVPLAGDVADVFWKAELRNVALLERHAQRGVPPTRGDYIFVLGCIGAVLVIALVPLVLLAGSSAASAGLMTLSHKGASERSERATRTERAVGAARERACRGVRGAKPLD